MEAIVYLTPLKQAFEKAANEKEAKGMKAYMLNQFEFYGIKTPQRDVLVKAFLKTERIQQYNALEKTVKYMWSQEEREWQYAAIDLLASHIVLWRASTINLIEYCLTHKSWWDAVDGIGSDWLPKYFSLFAEQQIPVTQKWNRSNNMWLQRSSILFQRSYKKNTNTQLLAEYILYHQSSKEFFIQKAIGWALREYSKTNPEWVLAFLSKNEIAPLSKREAIKRIKSK
jgi:3-methyladenine DNA glycosylase AlkD